MLKLERVWGRLAQIPLQSSIWPADTGILPARPKSSQDIGSAKVGGVESLSLGFQPRNENRREKQVEKRK
jgi:hypothetical protein